MPGRATNADRSAPSISHVSTWRVISAPGASMGPGWMGSRGSVISGLAGMAWQAPTCADPSMRWMTPAMGCRSRSSSPTSHSPTCVRATPRSHATYSVTASSWWHVVAVASLASGSIECGGSCNLGEASVSSRSSTTGCSQCSARERQDQGARVPGGAGGLPPPAQAAPDGRGVPGPRPAGRLRGQAGRRRPAGPAARAGRGPRGGGARRQRRGAEPDLRAPQGPDRGPPDRRAHARRHGRAAAPRLRPVQPRGAALPPGHLRPPDPGWWRASRTTRTWPPACWRRT
jgi:hypothetical protein